MTTLHIINAPQTTVDFATTLSLMCANDSVIFIQDGCYSLNAAAIIAQLQSRQLAIYAIDDDLNARNVPLNHVINGINYEGFVDLTLDHHKTISW